MIEGKQVGGTYIFESQIRIEVIDDGSQADTVTETLLVVDIQALRHYFDHVDAVIGFESLVHGAARKEDPCVLFQSFDT